MATAGPIFHQIYQTYQSTVFFITHPTKPYLLEQMLVFFIQIQPLLIGQHLIKDFQNVIVTELEYHISSNTLFAGTYGRGLWVTSLPAMVPPTSSFSYNIVNECAGLVSFSSSSANAVSIEWDFGDNSSSNESTTTHQFSTSGIYNVRLVAVNELGMIPLNKAYLLILSVHQLLKIALAVHQAVLT